MKLRRRDIEQETDTGKGSFAGRLVRAYEIPFAASAVEEGILLGGLETDEDGNTHEIVYISQLVQHDPKGGTCKIVRVAAERTEVV